MKLKTVGELIELLKQHPADMPVGVYVYEAEEGGYFTNLKVQKAADESTILYHKGDNPLDLNDIPEMLTICGEL